MGLSPIDIDALPMLETAVGLFGSIVTPPEPVGPSLFDIILTIVLIMYD